LFLQYYFESANLHLFFNIQTFALFFLYALKNHFLHAIKSGIVIFVD